MASQLKTTQQISMVYL